MTTARGQRLWLVASLLYCLAILLVTLRPDARPELDAARRTFCLICGPTGTAEAILNIFLFVPLGVLLVPVLGRFGSSAAGTLLSVVIELAQLGIPGRQASVADVLCNAAGAGLGAYVTLPLARAIASDPAWRRRAFWTWATFSVLVLFVWRALLTTSVGEHALFGHWPPDLGHTEPYRGKVSDVSIGGEGGSSGRPAGQEGIRGLFSGSSSVDAHLVVGLASPGLASILAIVDERRELMLFLAADGEDLVFRRRYLADDVRLDRPDLRFRGALAGFVAGDTLSVHLEEVPEGGYLARVNEAVYRAGHTPGRSWSLLLYPTRGSELLKVLADLAWLALLGLPLGFLASSGRAAVTGAAVLAAAFAIVPWASPVVTTPWREWAAAALGVLLGYAIGRRRKGGAVPAATPPPRS